MKKQIKRSIKAHLFWSALILLLLVAICAIPLALAQRMAAKPSVINSRTQPTPAAPPSPAVFATTGPWEPAQELGNGIHKVTSPFVFTVTNTNDTGTSSLRQ